MSGDHPNLCECYRKNPGAVPHFYIFPAKDWVNPFTHRLVVRLAFGPFDWAFALQTLELHSCAPNPKP